MLSGYSRLPRDGGGGGGDAEIFAEGSSTPLRAGLVRLPRLRLLEKHAKLETVPLYVSAGERIVPARSFFHGCGNGGGTASTRCSADRFIPLRKGQNFEAAHHRLITESPEKRSGRVLDLPEDLDRMSFAWRKLSMARALRNVIPGTGRIRLLNLSQRSAPVADSPPDVAARAENPDGSGEPAEEEEEEEEDYYEWPARPRRRPTIGQPDTILDIPNFRGSLRKSLLDWSSRNMIAAVIDRAVCVVNGDLDLNAGDTKFLFRDRCTAVGFSNSGDRIAIGRESSTTSVHGMNPDKTSYEFKCAATDHPFTCQPQAYAWSSDDRYLLVGCSGGHLEAVDARRGRKTKIVEASALEIVTVSFSPNDRFVATSGREPIVRIFAWPDLRLFMEIGYYAPVRAMAWHPWESGLLCIGGGEGDGGLSVWHVQRRKSLVYRGIGFDGSVDAVAWNKLTGEMVVNWFVRERERCFVALPVYASFDRVTDAIVPTLKSNRIPYVAWSPDGSQIACQARESVFVYNFVDGETRARLDRGGWRGMRRRRRRRSRGRGASRLGDEGGRSISRCHVR